MHTCHDVGCVRLHLTGDVCVCVLSAFSCHACQQPALHRGPAAALGLSAPLTVFLLPARRSGTTPTAASPPPSAPPRPAPPSPPCNAHPLRHPRPRGCRCNCEYTDPRSHTVCSSLAPRLPARVGVNSRACRRGGSGTCVMKDAGFRISCTPRPVGGSATRPHAHSSTNARAHANLCQQASIKDRTTAGRAAACARAHI